MHVYKRRWYTLIVYSCIYALQAAYHYAFTSIASSVKVVFGWENWHIAVLIICGPVMTALTMFPTTYLLQSRGIRHTAAIASGLVLMGAILRCIPLENEAYFAIAVLAAILNGMAGPAVLTGPTTLSAVWFPPHQRTISTSLCLLSGDVGLGVAFLFGPSIVPGLPCAETEGNSYNCTKEEVAKEKLNIETLFRIYAGIIGFLFLLVLVYFPSHPPKPPSISASTADDRKDPIFLKDIGRGISNCDLWVLILTAAATFAISNAWLSVINVMWVPLGISQQEVGFIGFLASACGKILNPIVAKIASIFKRQLKWVIIVSNFISCGFSCWVVAMTLGYIPLIHVCLYIGVIACISLVQAIHPIYLEVGCEMVYPVSEAVTTGIITFILNASGIIFLSVFFIPNMTTDWMNWLFGACMILAVPVSCFIRPGYRRLNADENCDNSSAIENDGFSSRIDSKTNQGYGSVPIINPD